MPTIKPRVNVTLSQDVHQALKDYSDVTGVSMSSFISSVLEQSKDSLILLTKMVKTSKSISEESQNVFMDSLNKSELIISTSLDNAMVDLRAAAASPSPAVRERGGEGADGERDSNPLAINKGVRLLANHNNAKNVSKKHIFLATSQGVKA